MALLAAHKFREIAVIPAFILCIQASGGRSDRSSGGIKSNEKAPMWCDFGYRFSYHIANEETLTVGERDCCIGGMITAVEKFWNDTTLDDLLTMTKSNMISRLNSLAAEYSTDNIVITISAEQVHFDHTKERPELP